MKAVLIIVHHFVRSLPTILSDKKMYRINQKGIVHLLPLLLLAIGLIAGVYLVTSGNPLKLFSKAGGAPIFFMNLDESPLPVNLQGVAQTSSPTVRVGLSSTDTVAYRGALNPADLKKSDFTAYTENPTTYEIELKSIKGIQIYWVEFKGANGKIDRKSAKIEVNTVSPTPRATSLPTPPSASPDSCQPRPACLDSKPRCLLPEPADGWCSSSSSSRACTEEAKQCPDGSYVGRTGPNCEFAPCPGK